MSKKITFEGENISPERLPQPSGWRILVGMIKIETKSDGGIILTDEHVKGKNYLRHVAKVLALGPDAYKDPKFQNGISLDVREPVPWAKIGDIIMIRHFEGQDVICLDKNSDSQTLRLMNDDEVLAVISDISTLSL